MIFDTDVLIWAQRGNLRAVEAIRGERESRSISVQTYLELLQDARNRSEQNAVRTFLTLFKFAVIPITEEISHRACVYIEQFSLSHGLRAGDALIAATAAENNFDLQTANRKHYRQIPDLKLIIFEPLLR